MCAICLSNPCNSRCPNAPEPIAVDDCFLCDKPIRVGEEYFTISSVAVCTDCAETMNMKQLSNITGLGVTEIIYEMGGEEKVGECDYDS